MRKAPRLQYGSTTASSNTCLPSCRRKNPSGTSAALMRTIFWCGLRHNYAPASLPPCFGASFGGIRHDCIPPPPVTARASLVLQESVDYKGSSPAHAALQELGLHHGSPVAAYVYFHSVVAKNHQQLRLIAPQSIRTAER